MLIAIYHLIKDGTIYYDLGPNHSDELTVSESRTVLCAASKPSATVTLEEVSA